MNPKKLRVITFNYLPFAYQLATEWIHENGHQHVLAITTPGPKSRPTPAYREVIDAVPRDVDVLVTTRLRKVATPLIRALKPDVILCFSFPYQITPAICAIPTYGAINIHPSILPAYRGPNPMRQFYDGATRFGSTAHWIAPGYDTGNILSQPSAELPKYVTPATTRQWRTLIRQSIDEGMAMAVAGACGIPQDHAQATYGGAFTEEETWLDFHEPTHIILRKTMTLNLTGGLAKARIHGEVFNVDCAETLPNHTDAIAGSVIKQDPWGCMMGTADGAIRLQTQPFSPDTKPSYPLALQYFS